MIRDARWIATALCAVALTTANVAEARSLFFTLNVGAEFTDNRDSVSTGEADNTDITVSPRGTLRLVHLASLFEVYYEPSLRHRTDPGPTQNDEEVYHRLGLDLVHDFSERLEIDIRERLSYTDDPAIDAGSVTLREDGSYLQNIITAILGVKVTQRTVVDLEVRNRIRQYDEDAIADVLDETETSGSVTLWSQMNRETALIANVGAGTTEYEDPDIDRDYDAVSGVVGVYRALGNGARVDLRAGARTISFSDATVDDDTGPIVSLSAYTDPKAEMRLNFTARHETRNSDLSPFPRQDYTSARVTLVKELSKKLSVRGVAHWSESEYKTEDLPAGVAAGFAGGTEDMVMVQAGVEFKVDDNNTVKLRHSFQTVDSDVVVTTDRDYDRNATYVGWQLGL